MWNNDAEPETLDPALMTGVTEGNVALALFEGLTTHHPRTLHPLPGVATRWEVSGDGLVYTFHLRKDAKWSNGDPVTAEDFRWSSIILGIVRSPTFLMPASGAMPASRARLN